MFGFGDMFGGGRRRGGPQRGADLRYDLEISFEEAAQGRRNDDSDSPPGKVRNLQRIGCSARLLADDLLDVSGPGPGPHPAGLLHRRAHVPAMPGRREDITKPCQTCHGAGRVSHERKITVKIPAGIATGQQLG